MCVIPELLMEVNVAIYKDQEIGEELIFDVTFRNDVSDGDIRDKVIDMIDKHLTIEKINQAIDFSIEEAGKSASDLNNVDYENQYIMTEYSEDYKIDIDSEKIKESKQPFVTFSVINK